MARPIGAHFQVDDHGTMGRNLIKPLLRLYADMIVTIVGFRVEVFPVA
jgi:hypothetical protein